MEEQLLALYDQGKSEHRRRLDTFLFHLEKSLLQSRERFERCLHSLPEQVLDEAGSSLGARLRLPG